MKRILLSWSSGKDSAWCLHLLRQQAEYEIAGLLTTINEAAGRVFDAKLLHALPPGIDRCGERVEFHTFCAAGSMFSEPIAVLQGETVLRDGFCFADLLPARAGLHSWRSKPVC